MKQPKTPKPVRSSELVSLRANAKDKLKRWRNYMANEKPEGSMHRIAWDNIQYWIGYLDAIKAMEKANDQAER